MQTFGSFSSREVPRNMERGNERLIDTAHAVAHLKAVFSANPLSQEVLHLVAPRETGAYVRESKYTEAAELGLFVESRHETFNGLVLGEKEKGTDQVVEIGGGLNTRSIELSGSVGTYIDTDLPANVKTREKINVLSHEEGLMTLPLDALHKQDYDRVETKLAEGPVCIVAEGVFTYFDRNQIDTAFQNISSVLERHGGAVVFDIATQKGLSADHSAWTKASQDLLAEMYRSSGVKETSVAFAGLKEAKEYFISKGFTVEIVPMGSGMREADQDRYAQLDPAIRDGILKAPSIFVCRKERVAA